MEALIAAGYLIGAYLIGSIPFSYLTARIVSGTDLRRVGSGTVSGTGVGSDVRLLADGSGRAARHRQGRGRR